MSKKHLKQKPRTSNTTQSTRKGTLTSYATRPSGASVRTASRPEPALARIHPTPDHDHAPATPIGEAALAPEPHQEVNRPAATQAADGTGLTEGPNVPQVDPSAGALHPLEAEASTDATPGAAPPEPMPDDEGIKEAGADADGNHELDGGAGPEATHETVPAEQVMAEPLGPTPMPTKMEADALNLAEADAKKVGDTVEPAGGPTDNHDLPRICSITLHLITVDQHVQARAAISPQVVEEYAEAMREGAEFPPLIVFFDGETYLLADGFHRYKAAHDAFCLEFQCDVRAGGLREAILFAAGANGQHGLQRSKEDKHAAVLKLLGDEEWVKWSDRDIARHCHVGHQLVGTLRESTGRATTERKFVTKHRTEATMAVGKIGKANRKRGRSGASKDVGEQTVTDDKRQTADPADETNRADMAEKEPEAAPLSAQHPGDPEADASTTAAIFTSAGAHAGEVACADRQASPMERSDDNLGIPASLRRLSPENEVILAGLLAKWDDHLQADFIAAAVIVRERFVATLQLRARDVQAGPHGSPPSTSDNANAA